MVMRTEILYHGTDGDSILGIMHTGAMKPGDGKIFFSKHRWEDSLMHGGDTKRKATFVIKVRVSIPENALNYVTSTRGVPSTFVIETRQPLPAEVLEMWTRIPTDDGFTTHHVVGATVIGSHLGG